MKKMSKGANVERQVLANFREHVKKPDNTVADVILSCSQDVIGYFSKLKSIKAKLIGMSKKIGDLTSIDSLLDGFTLRYFIDKETGRYSCALIHGASKDRIDTLSSLTRLLIRIGELFTINKAQGIQTALVKKKVIFKTLRSLMHETMDLLEFTLESDDMVDFGTMNISDALTFRGKDINFQCSSLAKIIKQSVSIDDEKAREILEPLVSFNRNLHKLNTVNIMTNK